MKKLRIASLALLVSLAACNGKQDMPPYQGVKIGKPYQIYGRWYKPRYEPNYDETGMASWYGPGFHGKSTATGETYDQHGLTAAHPTLPLPSIVRVTNLENGKNALIRVNDRGPFAKNRIIDLSKASAEKLGVIGNGTARVRVQFMDQQTQQYVSTSSQKGMQYAMNELQDVVPAQASAIEDLRTKPQFYVMKVPVDQAPPPDAVVVSEQEAKKYPTKNIFEEAETLTASAEEETANPSSQPSALELTSPGQGKLLTAPAAGSYYVQAGTFGVEDNAKRLATRIERDYNAKIVRRVSGDKPFYRVMIGPYAEQGHARSTLSKLNSIGVADAKITRD